MSPFAEALTLSNSSTAILAYPCTKLGTVSLRSRFNRTARFVHQQISEQCYSVPPLSGWDEDRRGHRITVPCELPQSMLSWYDDTPVAVLRLDVGGFELVTLLQSIPSLGSVRFAQT